jgi:endonuclease/exonuclease/phosphatase family metal-dependent hydrolase
MNALLDDAFRVAGGGLGFTFPASFGSLPSLLRIDDIWGSDHFVVHDAWTESDSGTSDHHPVISELSLTQTPMTS